MHLKSVMNREYAIQLVYQLSILVHNYLNYPAIELVYGNEKQGVPTAKWWSKLTLQCISALLSANSTLSLPISEAEMRSLKHSGVYCSFWRNCSMLSKKMFQLLFHTCTTYITLFFVIESDRFIYFRQYISAEQNLEKYAFVIYGSIIFCVFPLILIMENFFALAVFLAGQNRQKVQTILSGFGNTVRIRVSMVDPSRVSNCKTCYLLLKSYWLVIR